MSGQHGMRLCSEPTQADRRMFWVDEDDCDAAQGSASRNFEDRLDLHLCRSALQLGAAAESAPNHRVSIAAAVCLDG
jgi:hypothetical protein